MLAAKPTVTKKGYGQKLRSSDQATGRSIRRGTSARATDALVITHVRTMPATSADRLEWSWLAVDVPIISEYEVSPRACVASPGRHRPRGFEVIETLLRESTQP